MENHYQKLNAKYKSKSFNPNKGKTHNIEIPFRMVIVGASGSGKTNCLMNLLKIAFNGTFSHLYLCVKNADEPLYAQMIDKLGDDITVYENGEVPRLADMVKNDEQLIIFDDLVGDKNATPEIIEYFKMARKKNISCCYLSQSYYKVDKFIRQNTNYIIIKKVSSKKDLKLILSEYSFNCDIKELEEMYHYSTKKFEDIMLLDILPSHVYHNFNERLL